MKRIKPYLIPLFSVCLILVAGKIISGKENAVQLQNNKQQQKMSLPGAKDDTLEEADKVYGFEMKIREGPYGLKKKGRQYLIDRAEDIYTLAELVNSGKEIEEGVLAAEASYRLLNDITLTHRLETDFTGIGTKEHPFNGVLDGDGHSLEGNFFADNKYEGDYIITYGDGVILNLTVNNLFKKHTKEPDENTEDSLFYKLLHVSFTVDMISQTGELHVIISDQPGCDELLEFLKHEFQEGCLYLTIVEASLDTAELADYIFGSEQYEIQIDWGTDLDGKQIDRPFSAEGFLSYLYKMRLPEDAGKAIGKETLLSFRRQRVNGLNCSTFLFEGWDEWGSTSPPVLILAEGNWEDKENMCQLITVSAPEYIMSEHYNIDAEDTNFDGFDDLMIRMGTSGGSGGNWTNYRSAIWNPDRKEFSFFSSMPEQITLFDPEEKRIIHEAMCGAGDETVIEYKVIEGEYIETRRLNWESWSYKPAVLYYYEYGSLVHEMSVNDFDDVIEQFPDMDFWRDGAN